MSTTSRRAGHNALALATALSLVASLGNADQRRGSGGGQSGGDGGHRRGGGERVGTAVPRGDGGARGGGRTTDASSGGGTSGRATSDGNDGRSRTSSGSGDSGGSRDREGRPAVGRAEPRENAPRGGGTTIYVPGGYYGGWGPWDWGYGGFGFGGYYGGWYDPWYGPPVYGDAGEVAGAVRLKVKPRDAQVYVDGYFAGQVDQYDGVFQRLRVEPGPHRIEVKADGYEPLMFEIRALPDQTVTYKGDLKRIP